MIWCIFLVFVSLASARNVKKVDPDVLDALRASGRDEEFAKLLGVDVSLVRPNDNEQRSDGERFLTKVSPLGDILMLEENEQERQGIDFGKYGGSRWPNNQIPYRISRWGFSESQKDFIEEAIADFNSRVENLQLVPRRGQSDYVQIINGNGCYSYLGRVGGQQPLSLQRNGCLTTGTVQHEFMHAAGFAHEHNRLDRDDHVTVLWENIPENWHSQYEKVDENDFVNIGPYEFYSVMHYPIWAPETYKDAFKIPDGVDRDMLGQNEGVTEIDIQKINELYS